MKEAICIVALAIILALIACSCNYKALHLNYNYKKAMVRLPDGTIMSGKLTQWSDYDNSDMVQVVIDGTRYLTHSSNCVLYD